MDESPLRRHGQRSRMRIVEGALFLSAHRLPLNATDPQNLPDSPLRDALDRRIILREDTSEAITCDEVIPSQTTQLTGQP
jgi:hypothetical protein